MCVNQWFQVMSHDPLVGGKILVSLIIKKGRMESDVERGIMFHETHFRYLSLCKNYFLLFVMVK